MQTEINFGPNPQQDPQDTVPTDSSVRERMEGIIKNKDWAKTAIGPLEDWPHNLHFLFNLCQDANYASCIFWGAEFNVLYNAGWNYFFGSKFQLGNSAVDFLEEEWQEVLDPIRQVLKEGEAVRVSNFYWTAREGEECCYDLVFNPIKDDAREKVEGVLAIATDVSDRVEAHSIKKRVEEALKIETVGIDFFTLEGKVTRANDAFLQMCGYTRQELREGKVRWDNMTPEEYMPLTQKALEDLKEKGQTEPYEKEYYRKDGSRWWGLFSSQMLEDGTGVEFIVDITERKKSELKYQTLFNSIDEAFAIIQVEFDEEENPVDYRYLEVNPAFKKQTGLKEIEGRSTRKLLPDHEEYWYELYGNVARDRESVRFEETAREFGRVYDVFAFPFGEPEDRKIAVLFDDVTERRNAEEEREQILRKVETERQRLLDIFQHAPSFMCIFQGPDHVFERANNQYYKLVGDRDLIGKTVEEALPEMEGQHYIELMDRVYETGEPYVGKGEPLKVKKGDSVEKHFVDFVFQPYRNADGNITGVFVQGVDLTERIEAEKKLKSVNETLEERVEERTHSLLSYQDQLRSLASQLSKAEELERQRLAGELHDNLGQMLAVSKMKVDLLQKDELSEEITSDIEDLRDLIQDALIYTRELMSDLKPPPTLDHEDIKASMEWLSSKMEKHKLHVIIEDDGQHKPVNDEIRSVLVQCVRELLFNIVKHAGVDEATIRLSRLEGELQVFVIDEGKGFDPEADRSDATEGGFGLFNISERIDLLGGSLDIDSEPGEGTRVEIRVPLKEEVQQEEEVEDEEKVTPAKPEASQQVVKVLLVDDHEMMREGLRKIVNEENDLQVIAEASDGKEALKKAKKNTPHVVVMDVNMPVMDGIEATQRLMDKLPDLRIIALSLHDHQNVIDSMRSAGATAYLTKNEAFETLCATIRSEAALLDEIRK